MSACQIFQDDNLSLRCGSRSASSESFLLSGAFWRFFALDVPDSELSGLFFSSFVSLFKRALSLAKFGLTDWAENGLFYCMNLIPQHYYS